MTPDIVLFLLMAGVVGGFLSGLLGIGGGVIFVPALHYIFVKTAIPPEHLMHVSVATSLATVTGAVMTSAWKRYKKSDVDWRTFKNWAPFQLAGVFLGTWCASRVDSAALEILFIGITLLMSAYMAFGREMAVGTRVKGFTPSMQKMSIAGVGVLAAMTGMGGAVLTVPMMLMTGLPMQKATGTGSMLGLLVAIPAVISYIVFGWPLRDELPPYSLGYVNMPAALTVTFCAMAAALFGVKAAYALDKKIVRRIFAGVLLLVSLKMMLSL